MTGMTKGAGWSGEAETQARYLLHSSIKEGTPALHLVPATSGKQVVNLKVKPYQKWA